MCDCLRDIKENIRKEFPQKNKEYSKLEIEHVSCDNEIIYMTGGSKCKLFIPFMAEHKPIRRKKETKVPILAKFCPFCGQKYDE